MENKRSLYKSAPKHCQEKSSNRFNTFVIDTQERIHYAVRLERASFWAAGPWSLASCFLLLTAGHCSYLLVSGSASSKKQTASSQPTPSGN